MVVVLRKKIVSEVAYSDNLKTNKSSCCEHTKWVPTLDKNTSIFDMFFVWEIPNPFLN